MTQDAALLVFAKPPEPGVVKTRLLGMLSPQQAAKVHEACLADTLEHMGRVPGCGKFLQVAGEIEQARALTPALALVRNWHVSIQSGRDLGERMQEGFARLLRAGCGKVVIVGTDTPWMGAARVRLAFEWLATTEVVLGPSADGGYYLVGARRLVPSMFRGIAWGTAHVLESTLTALEKTGATYRLLARDFDVDRAQDLARAAELLRAHPERAPRLAAILMELERRHSEVR